MLTMKPTDNDRSKAPARTGHGAASVIPHLKEESQRSQPAIVDDVPAGEAPEAPQQPMPGPAGPKKK
jgi:hypothetical protein